MSFCTDYDKMLLNSALNVIKQKQKLIILRELNPGSSLCIAALSKLLSTSIQDVDNENTLKLMQC